MRNRGFTFIETVIYLAITGVVLLSTTTFLVWILRFNKNIETIGGLNYFSHRSLLIFDHEVKRATGINYEDTNFGDSEGRLVLNGSDSILQIYFCSERVCLEEEGEVFYLTPGNMIVEELRFEKIEKSESNSLSLSLTLKKPAAGIFSRRESLIEVEKISTFRNYEK